VVTEGAELARDIVEVMLIAAMALVLVVEM
jgi:hypothetical protein